MTQATDADVQAVQKQQQIAAAQAAIAQSRAQIAQAEVTQARAALPADSTIQPQAGSVDDSAQSGILAKAVALSALDKAADALVAGIFAEGDGAGKRYLLVEGAALTAADLVYQQTLTTLTGLTRRLDDLTAAVGAATPVGNDNQPPPGGLTLGEVSLVPGAAGMALAGTRSALGALADIVGYFSGLVTVRGVDLTISSPAALSSVAAALHRRGVRAEVVVTGLSLVGPGGPLLQALSGVAAARADLARAISRYGLSQQQTAAGAASVTQLTAELAAADTIVAAMASPPPDGGQPILAQAATAEVAHLPERGIDGILAVSVDAAGGETVTVSGILRRTRVSYVGACRLSAILTDPATGTVLGAGSGFAGAQADFRPTKDLGTGTTWNGLGT